MNKYCPKCKMNFSESFNECPYCEGELIIQKLFQSEEHIILDDTEDFEEDELLKKSDEQLIIEHKSYLESIRKQGYNITDEEFVRGVRRAKKERQYERYVPESFSESTKSTESIVTCPYCHSDKVSRISILGRIVSVELWGLASNKLGKQWHCDNCGSNF